MQHWQHYSNYKSDIFMLLCLQVQGHFVFAMLIIQNKEMFKVCASVSV